MSSSGARRRLLLVSTNYAPEHAGIGPYATQIAEHWAAGGAEVHVLTGMPHYPAWRLDPAYAGVKRVEEDRSGVRVHRRAHAVPARQTAVKRVLFEVSVLRGGRDEPAGMERPDAVFAQMPSLAGGVIGARLAERYKVPFVPIVQDLMGAAAAQSGIRGGALAAAAAGSVERYVLRRAALVGVIHETFVAKVAAMGVPERRIRLVRNWSHVRSPSRPREEMRARLGWRPGQPVLLHSGNMGLKQGLEVLIEAARLAPEVRVVLMGDGNQREQLRALAGGLPNLDFMPPAGDEEFADVLAAADVLVVTQRGSVRDMSLPSKLTSYFAAGRPVIAAVAADSGTAQEIADSGAGVVVPPESPGELLTAAAAVLSDPARAATLAAAGPAYAAAHLTREAGLTRIDALLSEALTLPPPARTPEPPASPAPQPAAEPIVPPHPEPTPPVPAREPVMSPGSATSTAEPDQAPAAEVSQVASAEPGTEPAVLPKAPPMPVCAPDAVTAAADPEPDVDAAPSPAEAPPVSAGGSVPELAESAKLADGPDSELVVPPLPAEAPPVLAGGPVVSADPATADPEPALAVPPVPAGESVPESAPPAEESPTSVEPEVKPVIPPRPAKAPPVPPRESVMPPGSATSIVEPDQAPELTVPPLPPEAPPVLAGGPVASADVAAEASPGPGPAVPPLPPMPTSAPSVPPVPADAPAVPADEAAARRDMEPSDPPRPATAPEAAVAELVPEPEAAEPVPASASRDTEPAGQAQAQAEEGSGPAGSAGGVGGGRSRVGHSGSEGVGA